MECYQIMNKDYAYAQTHGYKGSHSDYVKQRYSYYCQTMKRKGINHLNWWKWLQAQSKG